MRRTLIIVFVSIAGLLVGQNLQAQDLLRDRDLSQVKVDRMSDADVAKLKTQLSNAGMTIDEVEQVAISKGMPASEFTKLRKRLNDQVDDKSGKATGKLKVAEQDLKKDDWQNNKNKIKDAADSLYEDTYTKPKPKPLIDPLIFGSELYTMVAPSFEPNLKLATPLNYILGPEDQISISVYGVQQYEGELIVTPEGVVNVPNVGPVRVAGMTIEAATQKLRNVMGNSVYPYLKSGGSKLSVTVSKIRTIQVSVIGSNRPATYTVSSLSTVFNVLYLSGGPGPFGSFREIELVRVGQPVRKIDMYRFLLHGDQTDNIGLRDNDVIRIPAYKTRVELQGQIKRPGIFEVLPGESFQDILAFASGFTDTAYSESVKIFQRDSRERTIKDLPANDYANYKPQSGDIFVVSKILNRFTNRVKITGAVFRPDTYELTPGLKVGDLIKRADGLREDAYVGRGQVLRLENDLTRSILSFDIGKSLMGDPENNIVLKREDEVMISAVTDLRDSFKVNIQGEIRFPGQYDYVQGLTLKDLILQAGSFTDAAFKNVEIARLIRRDSLVPTDKRASAVINLEINPDLSSSVANIPLQSFDVITVRRKAGYTLPQTVTVSGQVQYPGPYALSRSDERVSDILARAGGYAPDAYPTGAFLKRFKTETEKKESLETLRKAQKKVSDTSHIDEESDIDVLREYDQIPLDLELISRSRGSIQDIILRANDELHVPKFDAQVKISGGILQATQIPYSKTITFREYISAAGGYSADAWKRGAHVVYSNGKAASIRHFLFFKNYPKILPGSEIVVPRRVENKKLSTGELIGISSALASLAGVVIAIMRL